MLDTAENLIRQTGGTDFSMREFSAVADVSTASTYNLFGSKEALLFGLLTRSQKPFMTDALNVSSHDPLERILEAAENVVDILTADPAFLRPLYRVVMSLKDPILHPAYMRNAFFFYRSSLKEAVESNLFADANEDPQALASALMAYFMGVMDLWIQEDIKDDMFRAQILHGYIHMLWPLARGDSLEILKKRHSGLKKVLAKSSLRPYYFQR